MQDELKVRQPQQEKGKRARKQPPVENRRAQHTGSVFHPTPDTEVWYISYYVSPGRQKTESSRSTVKTVAQNLLKARLAAVERGETEPAKADKLRVSDLLDDVLTDYEVNKYSTLKDAKIRVRLHLAPFFGAMRAAQLRNSDCQRYISARRQEEASDATVVNELSLLKRSFRLAVQGGKLPHAPFIGLIEHADVPREGFLEPVGYRALLVNLPAHVRPIVSLAFYTGARSGELKSLRWSQVDLRSGLIRLTQEDTKTRSARILPVAPEPLQLLLERKRIRDTVDASCEFVFFRERRPNIDGPGSKLVPLGDFRKAWEAASLASGLGQMVEVNGKERYTGLLFHDLRRSFCRAASRSGIPEAIVCRVGGWKTRAVFDRYNIVNEADLSSAARTVSEHVKMLEQEAAQGQVPQQLPN